MAHAKIDKEAIIKDLNEHPEGGMSGILAKKYKCSPQYIRDVAKKAGMARGKAGRKPRDKTIKLPFAQKPYAPEFETIEAVLGEKRGAIDYIINVIQENRRLKKRNEEIEPYARAEMLRREAQGAEEKKKQERKQQKMTYRLAVQHGELPNLGEQNE